MSTIIKLIKLFTPPILFAIPKKLRDRSIQVLLTNQNTEWALPSLCIQQTHDLGLPNIFKITRDGYNFPFYIRNNTSDTIVYKSIIENNEYNFITSQEPKVIIDAGANIGLSAIYFAERFPNAKIISIEPEENNFRILKENTKNYPNIIALKAALWDKVSKIELLDVGLNNWGFMTGDESNYDNIITPKIQKIHTVDAVTIESLLSDYSLDMIDILKIDIEGAEKEVFQNHTVWINNVRSILLNCTKE